MKYDARSRQRPAGRKETRARRFLIANLELKLQLTPIRISNLYFSNRKFFALFSGGERSDHPAPHAACPGLLPTSHSSLATAFLIVTPRLEFLAKRTKHSRSSKSNRYKTAFSPLVKPNRCSSCSSLITRHSSLPLHPAPATPNMASRNPTKEFCSCDPIAIVSHLS